MLRILLVALEAAILFALFNAGIRAWQGARAVRLFRQRFGAEGKDLLLVYSPGSPWAAYVESEWLPRWGARAVLRKWPEDAGSAGADPGLMLFRAVSGSRPRTPVAVVVPPAGGIRVVRFWRLLRARGGAPAGSREEVLHQAEAQVDAALMQR